MKYCIQCKKFTSALGLEGLTLCVMQNHQFTDKTFDDIYREAMKNE